MYFLNPSSYISFNRYYYSTFKQISNEILNKKLLHPEGEKKRERVVSKNKCLLKNMKRHTLGGILFTGPFWNPFVTHPCKSSAPFHVCSGLHSMPMLFLRHLLCSKRDSYKCWKSAEN